MLTNGQCKTIFKQPFDDSSIITINYSIQYITLNNPPKKMCGHLFYSLNNIENIDFD